MFGVVVDGDMGGAGVLAGFLCHHPTAVVPPVQVLIDFRVHAKAPSTLRPRRNPCCNPLISFAGFARFASLRETGLPLTRSIHTFAGRETPALHPVNMLYLLMAAKTGRQNYE
jgi:hypothetical protein